MLIKNMEQVKENVGKKVRCTFGWCEPFDTKEGFIHFGKYPIEDGDLGIDGYFNIILIEDESKSFFDVTENDFEEGGYIKELKLIESVEKTTEQNTNLKNLLKFNRVVEISGYGMGVVECCEKKIMSSIGCHDIETLIGNCEGEGNTITKIYENTPNGLELVYNKEEDIDWSKVEVDTPVLVRQHEDNEWRKRHFAKYENGKVYVWNGGMTSFTTDNNDISYTEWKQTKLYKEGC